MRADPERNGLAVNPHRRSLDTAVRHGRSPAVVGDAPIEIRKLFLAGGAGQGGLHPIGVITGGLPVAIGHDEYQPLLPANIDIHANGMTGGLGAHQRAEESDRSAGGV
jgi:hypothetical protein